MRTCISYTESTFCSHSLSAAMAYSFYYPSSRALLSRRIRRATNSEFYFSMFCKWALTLANFYSFSSIPCSSISGPLSACCGACVLRRVTKLVRSRFSTLFSLRRLASCYSPSSLPCSSYAFYRFSSSTCCIRLFKI